MEMQLIIMILLFMMIMLIMMILQANYRTRQKYLWYLLADNKKYIMNFIIVLGDLLISIMQNYGH